MELKIALSLSVFLQFLAFAITISLIPKTKFKIAWISISIGYLLMAVRRLTELFYVFESTGSDKIVELNGWVAVIISVSMLVASFYIRKIFQTLNRMQDIQKRNEAKLLSAVITTEEKQRFTFSKELHDGLGPVLSSAKMKLSALDRNKLNKQNAELLNSVEETIDYAILTTKEISNNLTPHVLERYGLQMAIETFIRNLNIDNSISVDTNIFIGEQRLNHNVEVILYRICCELINNTLKYAKAQKISVLIKSYGNEIVFIYEDDGIGFNIQKKETVGMGLTNMRSRVKSLNGKIEFVSSENRGFYANIILPKE